MTDVWLSPWAGPFTRGTVTRTALPTHSYTPLPQVPLGVAEVSEMASLDLGKRKLSPKSGDPSLRAGIPITAHPSPDLERAPIQDIDVNILAPRSQISGLNIRETFNEQSERLPSDGFRAHVTSASHRNTMSASV